MVFVVNNKALKKFDILKLKLKKVLTPNFGHVAEILR